MADYVPDLLPGQDATYVVGGTAVTGGQVVYASGAARTVLATTAASNACVGVAEHDAAAGAPLTVSRGGVQLPTAGGSITAGTPVKSAANGRVVAWVSGTDGAELLLGVALDTGTNGNTLPVAWRA